MGCPVCNWKTLLLIVAGFIILFLPIGYFSYSGLGLILFAYVWAYWPKKKTCETDETGKMTCKPR